MISFLSDKSNGGFFFLFVNTMNKSRRHIQRAMEIMKNQSFGTPTVLITDEKSMLDQITFSVETDEIDLTIQSVQDLSPMRFRYRRSVSKGDHMEEVVVLLHGFEEVVSANASDRHLSNEERNMKMARYLAIRQAWEYCQNETHEIDFQKQFQFFAHWKDSGIPIIEISCKLVGGNVEKLAYSLEIKEGDHLSKVEAPLSGKHTDMHCSLNACIWRDPEKYKHYYKLTAKNAHHTDAEGDSIIDRPSVKVFTYPGSPM